MISVEETLVAIDERAFNPRVPADQSDTSRRLHGRRGLDPDHFWDKVHQRFKRSGQEIRRFGAKATEMDFFHRSTETKLTKLGTKETESLNETSNELWWNKVIKCPHWWIYECTECKIKLCRSCTPHVQTTLTSSNDRTEDVPIIPKADREDVGLSTTTDTDTHHTISQACGAATGKDTRYDAFHLEHPTTEMSSRLSSGIMNTEWLANYISQELGGKEEGETTMATKVILANYRPSLYEFAVQDPIAPPTAAPKAIDHRSSRDTNDSRIRKSRVTVAIPDDCEIPWLIERLKSELALNSTGHASSTIRKALTQEYYHGGTPILLLDWDPVAFLKDQYGPQHKNGLAEVLCIVGTATCAYASTCRGYLDLVWPRLGSAVLDSLDLWLASGATKAKITPDNSGVVIDLLLWSGELSCAAHADAFTSAVEACEIICWLSLACRANPHNLPGGGCPAICLPKITCHPAPFIIVEPEYSCLEHNASEGACWQSIFWNPVVTMGYPIPGRDSSIKGLQIDLEVMARLTEISQAMMYDDILMLKGLCNMFVPTAVFGTSVLWHYVLNADFSWMSHNRAEEECKIIAKLDLKALESATTHFVGWLPVSELNIEANSEKGHADTKYDAIGFSGGDIVGPGCAVDGFTLNISKYFGVATKVQPARKDSRLLYAAAGPYERLIKIAAKTDVIIYDVTSRRGWLVGGDDALLFLSRAAISHQEGERVRQDAQGRLPKDMFQHMDIRDPTISNSTDVLLHEGNRDLVIYDNRHDPSHPWRFEDLVHAKFDVLQEMKSRRAKLRQCETQQWEIRKPWVKNFVGIGCLDIVSGETSLRPRSHQLSDSAAQWLRLADAIDTVNIIGARIDDLIMPSPRYCNGDWNLPKNRDILAAPLKRLRRIAEIFGTVHPDCVELAKGVFWNDPEGAFHSSPCRCETQEPEGCRRGAIVELRDRRETFLKGARNSMVSCSSIGDRYPAAAIGFGTTSGSSRLKLNHNLRMSASLHRFLHPKYGELMGRMAQSSPSGISVPPTPEIFCPQSIRANELLNATGESNGPNLALDQSVLTGGTLLNAEDSDGDEYHDCD
ncbi:hypothetical protein Q7P37_008376 [Cladosporium fusiforme]